jgi:molybdopterin molybdotransferase
MLTPTQAETLIQQHLVCLPIESLPLAQCMGAVLRENIYAERDQPPFDRVTMDGIAIDSAMCRDGVRSFLVEGVQAAGDSQARLARPQGCIEVMTGSVLPHGCDAVVPFEQVELGAGRAELHSPEAVAPGQNIHKRGSDSKQGDLLLELGTVLRAPEIAVAASAGMSRVRVSSQPAVMIVSTGNELIEPGEPILDHQLRRSNAYGVAAALRQRGFNRVGDDHLPDVEDVMGERLRLHLDTHEVLVLSGGVSMGRYDLVPKVLAELGVRTVFHRIAQKPGKPMWFGVTETGQAVFALPGNPVSTLVCLVRYVLPALYGAMGLVDTRVERIATAEPIDVAVPLSSFVPVEVSYDDWGRPWARPRVLNTSGDFAALAGTDGFVELPLGPGKFPKGFVTRLFRW